ncbi:MAG: hypothetical protein GXO97_07430 [Nitrospirae bacterium]|nr:hypothetical protein [Nitrospirota bacterium]
MAKKGSLTMEDALKTTYELGRELAPVVSDLLSVDSEDASSLAKIVEFVNSLLDIKGRVVKSDKNMVIRHERECLLSGQFAERKSPYYCHLFQAMYKGLLCELNPCARANVLEITKSMGGEYCEIITTIERDSRSL